MAIYSLLDNHKKNITMGMAGKNGWRNQTKSLHEVGSSIMPLQFKSWVIFRNLSKTCKGGVSEVDEETVLLGWNHSTWDAEKTTDMVSQLKVLIQAQRGIYIWV
jgi:hypothetical protein